MRQSGMAENIITYHEKFSTLLSTFCHLCLGRKTEQFFVFMLVELRCVKYLSYMSFQMLMMIRFALTENRNSVFCIIKFISPF